MERTSNIEVIRWAMRTFLSMAVACWGLGLFAQGFNKRYDAFGQGYAQGAFGIERSGSDFLVFAFSYEPDTVSPDSLLGIHAIILQRISSEGILLSEKRHKVPQHSLYLGTGNCCDSVAGGGYITGGTWENLDLDQHVRLIRYDANGDTLWSRDFGEAPTFWGGEQVKTLLDGGFLVCGFTDTTGYVDGFAIRTDANGDALWQRTYGSEPSVIDAFVSVVEGSNGDLYLSGAVYPSDIDGQHWVQRTNAEGDVVWSSIWGGPYKEGDTGLSLLSDGYPLAAGGSGGGPDYTDMRPYLAKIDTVDGSRIWEREYGAAAYINLLFAAKQCPSTRIIGAGVSYASGHEQGQLLCTTSEGDSLWMRRYYYHDDTLDQGQGRFYDVLPTDDGGYIAAGFANGAVNAPLPPGYSQDAWVVKVDSMGCIVPGCDGTGVMELITNLQGAITLSPNPAHGEVQVRLDLPANFKHGIVDLSIVGMDGRVVRRVPWAGNGSNAMRVDVSDLSAGMYTLHVTDGTKWITGTKLIIE